MPLLSMANRAASEPLDLVFLHKFLPKYDLIRGWLPIHAEDVLAGPYKPLRITVALQTPLHIQRVLAPHKRHLIHSSVAGHTAHAFVDMNAVIEIDEARQVVHPCPLDRLSGSETLAHRFQNRALRPDLGMATHADLGGRNPGERGLFHRSVAVTAIDAVVTDVVFVAELNRLAARDADLCHVRGAVNRRQRCYQTDKDNCPAKYGEP